MNLAKPLLILIIIMLSFCTTAENTTNDNVNEEEGNNVAGENAIDIQIKPILTEEEEEKASLTIDQIIDKYDYVESHFTAPKPIIADEEFIGEAYILTNKEYYAYLRNVYNIGKLNQEEYQEELMKAYQQSDSGNFSVVLSIWTDNEVYANPDNWKLELTINGKRYDSFTPSEDYTAPHLPFYVEEISRKYSNDILYEFNFSFSFSKLPAGSRPEVLTPTTLITDIRLDMYYEYSPETLTVRWNNSEFYSFYNIHNKVEPIVKMVLSEIPNTPIGNNVEFKYVKEFIPFGIKDVFLDMSLENFPYQIPNEQLGLLPPTHYYISSFLDNDEYLIFHKVRYVLYYISYYAPLDFSDYVLSRSKNKKYLVKRNILYEVELLFNDYLTERRMVIVPEDDPLREDFLIEKIAFMVRDGNIVSLSFYFGDEVSTELISELTSIFGEEKTINPRRPYAWNDRSRRLIYTSDSRALHFVNNSEVLEMVDSMERFLRFFAYLYESYYLKD